MKGHLTLLLFWTAMGTQLVSGSWVGSATPFPGFQHGSEYRYIEYLGRLRIECTGTNGQREIAYQNCREQFMAPVSFTRFIAEGSKADTLELEAEWANGTVRRKSLRFYPSKGYSGEVNLGINTLLQSSLLGMGRNVVYYKLNLGDSRESQGVMTVLVHDGGRRSCAPGFRRSSNPNDCRTYSRNLCVNYLQSASCD